MNAKIESRVTRLENQVGIGKKTETLEDMLKALEGEIMDAAIWLPSWLS